jgi:hypothetical protein
MRRSVRLAVLSSALTLALLLGACAKNGNGIDPTDFFSSDMFDTKKKLKGDRKEMFPTGVPGATTGVPPDLVKGYQAPPDPTLAGQTIPGGAPGGTPASASAGGPPGPTGVVPAATADAAAGEPAEEPQPKPKPKPKVARAKASDPIWDKKPAATARPASRPTQIEVNRSAPQPAAQPAAPTAQQPQQGGSVWPDPQPAQQQAGQSVFPAPPPPGTFSR